MIQQQPAIMNAAYQQAQSSSGQQVGTPTTFQNGAVKEEANVPMVGSTYRNSTSVVNTVNTGKDVLPLPPTPEKTADSAKLQHHTLVDHILVDSGPAAHVCPTGYAAQFPLEPLRASAPQLFTATHDPIKVYGSLYYTCKGQSSVIPYFACDVKYRIISVSRLIDRVYALYWDNAGTILRGPSLQVTLK